MVIFSLKSLIFTFFCQIIVTFAQLDNKTWTFLEELEIVSMVHRKDPKLKHTKGYEVIAEELSNLKCADAESPGQESVQTSYRKTKTRKRSKTNNIPYEVLVILSAFYVTNIFREGETQLISQLKSELSHAEYWNPCKIDRWIHAYIERTMNSERIRKLDEFVKRNYAFTRLRNEADCPPEDAMSNICEMISQKVKIPYIMYGCFVAENLANFYKFPNLNLSDRKLYHCSFDLEEGDGVNTSFGITLMPIYAPPYGYLLLFQKDRSYVTLDYVRIQQPNALLVGHKLVDPTYPVEPSIVKLK